MSWDSVFKDQYVCIEVTDFCNLNCIMCSHENRPGPHSRPRGFMSVPLFEKITNELPVRKAASGLKLFWLGEPFLNPGFPDMLRQVYSLTKNRNEYIDIHTNAHFLTKENREILLETGDKIPRLTVSLDAINPDTYTKIRRGGNLQLVIENLTALLNEREERGLNYPTLIFQFIIMNENSKEANEFQQFWLKKVRQARKKRSFLGKLGGLKRNHTDVVWFKRIDVPSDKREWAENIYFNTVKEQGLKKTKTPELEVIVSLDNLWESDKNAKEISETKSKAETEKNEPPEQPVLNNRKVCSAVFKTPMIMWDGSMTMCCFDPAMQYALGSLADNSFKDLWHGKRMEQIRLMMIRGEFEKIVTNDGWKKCSSCPGYDTPAISDDEIRLYLAERNMMSEWEAYLERMYGKP